MNKTITYISIAVASLLFMTPIAHGAQQQMKGWKSYRSSLHGFSIQYPSTFAALRAPFTEGNRFAFGQKKKVGQPGYDGEFFIFVHSAKDTNVDTLIRDTGGQFLSDRKEKRSKIKINGVVATRAVITTTSVPNWYAEIVLFKKGNKIYMLSNGAVKNPQYKKFYESFRFVGK